MKAYLELMRHVSDHGARKTDRTGTGTLSVFGWQMRFDLGEGFPMVTTKKLHTKSIIHELLWFLTGSTNVKPLQEKGVTIWDEWAKADGELEPVYGKQWRSWPAPTRDDPNKTIDQISQLMSDLRKSPDSRRLIVSAWNVSEIPQMALAPCHALFQFYVADGKLSCQLYQRSADIFLGVPFNIASYALLTHMVAQQCDLGVGDFIWTGGDCHLYLNHLEQAKEQLSRTPYPLPKLQIKRKPASIFDYQFEDFEIVGYQCHPHIKAPVASLMRLVLLAAVARNRAIGVNNTLPWHLPEDLKRFKSLTTDQTVAMGRKTFDSIVDRLGKPLPNRKSLVLTQNPAWKYADSADVSVIRSVDELSQVESETIFVIGGAQVYEMTISAAQELDITEVNLDVPGADAFFPAIDETQWEKESGDWQVSEKGIRFRFVTYRRKT